MVVCAKKYLVTAHEHKFLPHTSKERANDDELSYCLRNRKAPFVNDYRTHYKNDKITDFHKLYIVENSIGNFAAEIRRC